MKHRSFHICLLLSLGLFSCKKDWLSAKPDISIVTPSTVQDLQALLDNSSVFNTSNPVLGEMSADDYFVPQSRYPLLPTATEKNAYVWAADIFNGEPSGDWNIPYSQVFYANVVLESLSTLSASPAVQKDLDNARGSALFYRAFAFYNLAQEFAKPFMQGSLGSDPGIPLRLHSDINEPSLRSSVQNTYDQITNDLKAAIPLLPDTPLYKTRPSRVAAYGLLARTYLSMGAYPDALAYADSCLKHYNTLIDYNTLDTTRTYPFHRFHGEDIYHAEMSLYTLFNPNPPNFGVDTTLYASYEQNDLRRSVLFTRRNGIITFRGSYSGNAYKLYSGLATDEMLLIRAECYARKGATDQAMQDLNTLLSARYRRGTFMPLSAGSADDALTQILKERRKELPLRGLRWTDLRRLNQEARFQTTPERIINGFTYSLAPESNRYVLPIPLQEIQLSGIAQNPR